jgi:hypothetical protein
MLTLDKSNEFPDTDGERRDLSELLGRLQHALSEKEEALIWSDIWRALHHAFNISAEMYSAVPLMAALVTGRVLDRRLEYLHFVGVVEALRHRKDAPALPPELKDDYFAALKRTESLIIECLEIDWDESGYRALLGSLASVRAGIEFQENHHGNIWW